MNKETYNLTLEQPAKLGGFFDELKTNQPSSKRSSGRERIVPRSLEVSYGWVDGSLTKKRE